MKLLYCMLCMLICGTHAAAADVQAEGRAALAQGENALASKKFSEAAQNNPFDAAALNNQAVALAAQGEYARAQALLERAVRLAPGRADIAENLQALRAAQTRPSGLMQPSRRENVVSSYVQSGQLPPEPPPLWKTPTQ